ncbi:hypothetical protein AB835_08075 [Candidatus Endobugula sertula]|uniref:Uncharacterized protein n=1 Tax=Candidatus Endobugula sertula TaxID=62101 RepID=A0A1D2QPU3_9GAMM|nr:hypothetical protein AB835_08075 [Candidatus Endobugula sertula]
MKTFISIVMLLLSVFIHSTSVAQTVQTDRYTQVRVGPAPGQISPLDEITRIVLSDNFRTVGEAIEEVLDGTGYRLRHIKDSYEKPIDTILMSQPLPELHRRLGPITIRDALEVLAGDAWHLKENKLGRELWFVINPHYAKDKHRVQRLLKETSFKKAASQPDQFYLEFPPGNVKSPKNKRAFNQFIQTINQQTLVSIDVQGQSYSKKNKSSLQLAKARARWVEKALGKAGIPGDKLNVTYDARNHQPQSRSGVLVTLTADRNNDPDKRVVAGSNDKNPSKVQDQAFAQQVVEAPTVYRFYRGEDLESALRRWVKRAGYNNLVWNVKDKDQYFVTVPIGADAIFKCDFLECLSQVKRSYAEADTPRYFDIDALGGNKIVTIKLLHLDSNL